VIKRIFILLAIVFSGALAMATTPPKTPNFNLNLPWHLWGQSGETPGWDELYNDNFDLIDTAVAGKASHGANSDITSLTGLTTPLPKSEGGTGNTSGTAAGLSGNPAISISGQTFTPLSSAPGSPVDQMVYAADSVNWNPASLATVTQTATTIAFVSGSPATITDSGSGFITAGFLSGQFIKVTGSAQNNGTYQLAAVAAGTLTLVSGQTLTSESAGASDTITGGAPYICKYSANGKAGSAVYFALEDSLGNRYAQNMSAGALVIGTTGSITHNSSGVPLIVNNRAGSGADFTVDDPGVTSAVPYLSPAITDSPGVQATINTLSIPRVLCQSAVPLLNYNSSGWLASPTGYIPIATCAVPAGAMGLNGSVRITSLWSYTGSANYKNMYEIFGGTTVMNFQTNTAANRGGFASPILVSNRNSRSSQVFPTTGVAGTLIGISNYAPTTAQENTANQVTITFETNTSLESGIAQTALTGNGSTCTATVASGAYATGDYIIVSSGTGCGSGTQNTGSTPVSTTYISGTQYSYPCTCNGGTPVSGSGQRYSRVQLESYCVELIPGAN